MHFRALNSFRIKRGDRCLQIFAHQIQLVLVVLFTGMTGDFCWRQGEYQPAVTGIDRMKTQDVFEERSIGICVFAVNDYVGSIDHSCFPSLGHHAIAYRPRRGSAPAEITPDFASYIMTV